MCHMDDNKLRDDNSPQARNPTGMMHAVRTSTATVTPVLMRNMVPLVLTGGLTRNGLLG
jgi:hypothetical protein